MTRWIPDTDFGAKVRSRLQQESVVWLTTVNGRGIPQPNPVWFVWDKDWILTYNLASSARVRNVRQRPSVSLHFNQLDGAGDVVVLVGNASVRADVPPANNRESFLRKYAELMPAIGEDPASFAGKYSVPIAVEVDNVRGR